MPSARATKAVLTMGAATRSLIHLSAGALGMGHMIAVPVGMILGMVVVRMAFGSRGVVFVPFVRMRPTRFGMQGIYGFRPFAAGPGTRCTTQARPARGQAKTPNQVGYAHQNNGGYNKTFKHSFSPFFNFFTVLLI